MASFSDPNFRKTMCLICFEDLKPIGQHLQFISVCGHVFHERCLQQWFENCPGRNRRSCPVCKQVCSDEKIGRLYFQSEEDLSATVRRLESKVSTLDEMLDSQKKAVKNLNEKSCLCKEQTRKEAQLKNEALGEKAYFQQLLHSKSMDFEKSNLKCSKLQEKNTALAEELVTLKLRNKELMTKCNLLEEGHAHSSNNLDKAKEKISNLKSPRAGVAVEAKHNEVLWALENLKKLQNSLGIDSVSLSIHNAPLQNQPERATSSRFSSDPIGSLMSIGFRSRQGENLDPIGSLTCKAFRSRQREKLDPVTSVCISLNHEQAINISLEEIPDFQASEKDNACEPFTFTHGLSNGELDKQKDQDIEQLTTESVTDNKREYSVVASNNLVQQSSPLGGSTMVNGVRLDDSLQPEPVLNIRKENSSSSLLSRPGDDIFYAGGLLGSDGTNRYLGKWGKRAQQLISCLEETPFGQVSEKDNVLNIRKFKSSSGPPFRPGDICFAGGLPSPDCSNRYVGKWYKTGNQLISCLTGFKCEYRRID